MTPAEELELGLKMGPRNGRWRVLKKDDIAYRVHELGDQITLWYGHQVEPHELLVIGVLKGGVIFTADLVRQIKYPLLLDFIGARSYGGSRKSSGRLTVYSTPTLLLKDRHVLLVDDILGTGLTARDLMKWCRTQFPASVEICTLLKHPDAPAHIARWVGFEIERDQFVAGYGLDEQGGLRHLSYITTVAEE